MDENKLPRLGLKGFWKERRKNGQKFRYKLSAYFDELKRAFLRAWIGYDYGEIWSMDYRICKRFEVLLPIFLKHHHEVIDAPEVDAAVERMIELLPYFDEDYALEELAPDKTQALENYFAGAPLPKAMQFTKEDYLMAAQLSKSKSDEFFDLMKEHFGRLWI